MLSFLGLAIPVPLGFSAKHLHQGPKGPKNSHTYAIILLIIYRCQKQTETQFWACLIVLF